jgi:hypothetical protein
MDENDLMYFECTTCNEKFADSSSCQSHKHLQYYIYYTDYEHIQKEHNIKIDLLEK